MQESLEQFIAVGGFSIATSDNPWQVALEAGTITTPEEAATVAEAITNFTQHTSLRPQHASTPPSARSDCAVPNRRRLGPH